MYDKLLNVFMYTCVAILGITGVAKLVSVFGSALILGYPDPVFKFQFRHLMLAAGILEVGLAIICLYHSRILVANYLVAWFSTLLLTYRLGMWYMGWKRSCPCLGTLTDAIHISPETADAAMRIALSYLLIGSYGFLFWLWRQRKNGFASPLQVESA